MNEITVEVRNVYGNDLVYPICEKAKIFARIAGTSTLTQSTVQHVKALGYTVRVSAPKAL